MKHSLITALITIAACSASTPASKRPDVPAIVAEIAKKTVALYGKDHLCTGVWVSPRHILTAAHCIDIGGGLAYAVPGSSERRPSFLVRADLDHDLALYLVDGQVPDHLIAVPVLTDPVSGTEIFFSGHVFGLLWTFRHGYVAAYREIAFDKSWKGPWLQVSAPIQSGDSGGGFFDADGSLVGIVHAMAVDVPDVAFAAKASTVTAFLKGEGR